jgi:RecB family exonuclease
VRRRPDEERVLFAVCADAARRRLTLLCSRRDTALDRERTISQFFTRAAEALGLGRVRTTSLGVPTPDGPPIGAAEARRRALHAAGAPTVAAVFPPLARALDRRAALDRPEWTEYEGRIADRELRAALAAHAPGRAGPISASGLETFCRCPYQYFFRRVLRLSAWKEADEPSDLNPLSQGTLFHDAARRVATARRGRPFAELSDSAIRRLASAAAVESVAAFEEREGAAIAPALLRELALERLGAYVTAWLRFERSRGGDFAPAGAEVRFGPADARHGEEAFDPVLSTDTCAEAAIPGGSVLFRGRIDLLSHSAAAARQRLTDFKVKASAEGVKTASDARGKGAIVFSGEMLQLPVYALAAAGPVRERSKLSADIESEYLFVAPHPEAEEIAGHVTPIHLTADETREAVERLDLVLGTVATAIAEGVFRPRTTGIVRKEPCAVCDFDAICGPGHLSRYERKQSDADPAVRRLEKLGEIS